MRQEKISNFQERFNELIKCNPKEVWIVDDSEEIIKSILRFLDLEVGELGFQFEYYDLAQKALEELLRRKKEKRNLPGVIFVDGALEKDEGELSLGSELIKKIRKLEGIEQPKIIAFSSSYQMNEEMKEVGADEMIEKLEIRKAIDFLKGLVREEK